MATGEKPNGAGRTIVWGAILLLIVLHHDVWNWDSRTLIFGIIPLTLFYHVGISIAASVVWFVATRCAWPTDVDEDSSPATGSEAHR